MFNILLRKPVTAFGLVATLLTIEACGSRSALPTGFSQGSWMLPESATLRGEKFLSTKVSDKCSEAYAGNQVRFTATGKASGPFPGTFTANGHVGYQLKYFGYFSEKFEIHSGSRAVSGKVGTYPYEPAKFGLHCNSPATYAYKFWATEGYHAEGGRVTGNTGLTYDKYAKSKFIQTFFK